MKVKTDGGTGGNDKGKGSGGGTDQNDNGGGDDGSGGDDNDDGDDGGGNDDNPRTYTAEEYGQAQRDLHRFKERFKTADKELSTLKAQVAELKKASGGGGAKDAEARATAAEEARQAAEAKATELEGSITESRRMSALMPALTKLGFRDDAVDLLDLVDLSEIEIEATTKGRWQAHGVDGVVKLIKAKFPYAFDSSKVKGLNGGTAGGGKGNRGGGDWTADKIHALEAKLRKEGRYQTPDGRKEYSDAVKAWQEQRKAT